MQGVTVAYIFFQILPSPGGMRKGAMERLQRYGLRMRGVSPSTCISTSSSPKFVVLSTLPDNVTLLNYLIKQEDDWDFIVDMVIIYVELRWIESLESLDKLKVCMKNIDHSFRHLQHAG